MHSLENDREKFEKILTELKPNLLLIGAMTLCLPGAVECARIAKEALGDRICTVLGGRHVSESMYLGGSGGITHHPSSPLRLMAEGLVPSVFDLVVAGEGEHLIAWLGQAVHSLEKQGRLPATIAEYLSDVTNIPGSWILGCPREGSIRTIVQRGMPFDRRQLATPSEMFGVRTTFNVFEGRLTAHVFSDTGGGCAFDCSFCSERRSVTGPLIQLDTSADRLFRQFEKAVDVIREDSPAMKASAFVEDSTMLAGSIGALRRLAQLLGQANLDLRFGAQFTIDQILDRSEVLRELRAVGLDYLFIGIETPDPTLIGGMSKNVKQRLGSWLDRTERVLEILYRLRIRCGGAFLFGLGEPRSVRSPFFLQVKEWTKRYGMPCPVSMNWAVQHPLHGDDGGTAYRYTEWGGPHLGLGETCSGISVRLQSSTRLQVNQPQHLRRSSS